MQSSANRGSGYISNKNLLLQGIKRVKFLEKKKVNEQANNIYIKAKVEFIEDEISIIFNLYIVTTEAKVKIEENKLKERLTTNLIKFLSYTNRIDDNEYKRMVKNQINYSALNFVKLTFMACSQLTVGLKDKQILFNCNDIVERMTKAISHLESLNKVL
jgi:ATP-dependent Lon protease